MSFISYIKKIFKRENEGSAIQELPDITLKFRIIPAANGRWTLEKTINHLCPYMGAYQEWLTIGTGYQSIEEAKNDFIHLMANEPIILKPEDF